MKPDENIITLCEKCKIPIKIKEGVTINNVRTWKEVCPVCGFETHEYFYY